MKLRRRANRSLHRDENEKREKRRDSLDADRGINLTNPGTQRGMCGVRRGMVSMGRLFCL